MKRGRLKGKKGPKSRTLDKKPVNFRLITPAILIEFLTFGNFFVFDDLEFALKFGDKLRKECQSHVENIKKISKNCGYKEEVEVKQSRRRCNAQRREEIQE